MPRTITDPYGTGVPPANNPAQTHQLAPGQLPGNARSTGQSNQLNNNAPLSPQTIDQKNPGYVGDQYAPGQSPGDKKASQDAVDALSRSYSPDHQNLSYADTSDQARLNQLVSNQTQASPELQSLLDQGITNPSDLLSHNFGSDEKGNSIILNGQRVYLPSDIMDQLSGYHNAENTRQQQIAALHSSINQQQITNEVHGNPSDQTQKTQTSQPPQGAPQQATPPQMLPINNKNFPGLSIQQLADLRVKARQSGTPGKAPVGAAKVNGQTIPPVPAPSGASPLSTLPAQTGATAPSNISQPGAPAPGTPPQGGNAQLNATTDPTTAGMQAATANLPPEYQSLKPFFDNLISTIQAGQSQNAQVTAAELNGGTIDVNGQKVTLPSTASVFDDMDKKIKATEAGFTKMQEGIQGMLDKAKEQQDQSISDQENAALQRAQWQAQSQIRQEATNKRLAVESAIAGEAIKGGWGSSGAAQEISMAGAQFDRKIMDLQTTLGFQETDLAAKFSSVHAAANEKYTTDMIQLLKDTQTQAVALQGQSFASQEARAKADDAIVKDFQTQHNANAKELATAHLDMAKSMQTMIDAKLRLDQQQQVHEDNMALRQEAIDARKDALNQSGDTRKITMDNMTYDRGMNLSRTEGDRIQKELQSDKYISAYNDMDSKSGILQSISDKITKGDSLTASDVTTLEEVYSRAATTGTRIPVQIVNMFKGNVSSWDDLQGWIQKQAGHGNLAPELVGQINATIQGTKSALKDSATTAMQKILLETGGVNRKLEGLIKTNGGDPTDPNFSALYIKSSDFSVPGLDLPSDRMNNWQTNFRDKVAPPTTSQSGSFSPSGPMSSATTLKGDNLVSVLKQAGFSGPGLRTAYAIARAESAGNPGAIGDKNLANEKWGPSVGLFQIRSLRNPEQYGDPNRDASKLGDPLFNAKAAYVKSGGGKDFSPWSTYTNGSFRNYLSEV